MALYACRLTAFLCLAAVLTTHAGALLRLLRALILQAMPEPAGAHPLLCLPHDKNLRSKRQHHHHHTRAAYASPSPPTGTLPRHHAWLPICLRTSPPWKEDVKPDAGAVLPFLPSICPAYLRRARVSERLGFGLGQESLCLPHHKWMSGWCTSHTKPLRMMCFHHEITLGTFDRRGRSELNFEYNDRRNKIIPKEVQAQHPRASSVTNT